MKPRVIRLVSSFVVAGLALTPALTAFAGADNPSPGGATDPALLAVVNAVGDDVFSVTDLATVLDPAGPGATQHYGPYPSSSPDSGTCDFWANDSFDRHFTVHTDPTTGAIYVVEQFKDGNFVTTAQPSGPSPAGCDSTYTDHGTFVNGGVTGSTHGYFIITNVTPQRSMSPFCDAAQMTNADCTTATFINTHFVPCYPAACMVSTFLFDYAAGDQGLSFHDWKNASRDRGGNRGDIANG